MTSVADLLGPDFVAAVGRLVDERVAVVLAEHEARVPGRWLTGAKAAAAYMGCSERRVSNRLASIPHSRDGGRLMFHTDDLDAYLRGRL